MRRGADISVVVLDRSTGQMVSGGDGGAFPIASVVKLFIADDLLLQESQGKTQLSPADRSALDVMLRSSDDSAAENFWNRSGGSDIITRVVARYGLASTTKPYNGALGPHHEHRRRPGPVLRQAAERQRRATARAGQRHHGQSCAVDADGEESTATRSVSAFPMGSTPSPSPSNRGGSAVGAAPTNCMCPPA